MWKRARKEFEPEPGTVEWVAPGTGVRLLLIQISISVAFAIYASIYLREIRDIDIPFYLRVFDDYVAAIVPHIRSHTAVLARSTYESQIPFFRLTTSLIWGFNIFVGLTQFSFLAKIMHYYRRKIDVFRNKAKDNTVFSMNLGAHLVIIILTLSIFDGAWTFPPLGSSPWPILSMSNFVMTAIFSASLPFSVAHTIALLLCKLGAKQA